MLTPLMTDVVLRSRIVAAAAERPTIGWKRRRTRWHGPTVRGRDARDEGCGILALVIRVAVHLAGRPQAAGCPRIGCRWSLLTWGRLPRGGRCRSSGRVEALSSGLG